MQYSTFNNPMVEKNYFVALKVIMNISGAAESKVKTKRINKK